MLRTNVLREAEKPSGDVKTLADSTEVQPLIFEFIYFIFCGSLTGMCAQWNMLAILVPIMLGLDCRGGKL